MLAASAQYDFDMCFSFNMARANSRMCGFSIRLLCFVVEYINTKTLTQFLLSEERLKIRWRSTLSLCLVEDIVHVSHGFLDFILKFLEVSEHFTLLPHGVDLGTCLLKSSIKVT